LIFFLDTTGQNPVVVSQHSETMMKFWYYLPALLAGVALAQTNLLHYWEYDKRANFDLTADHEQVRDRFSIQNISFESQGKDRLARLGLSVNRVTACLVLPNGKGPFPAVIYSHWCMTGSEMKNCDEFLEEARGLESSFAIA
jgi:hypothetical protein